MEGRKELGIYKNLSGRKRGSQIKHTHTIHYINVFLTNFTYYDNMFSVQNVVVVDQSKEQKIITMDNCGSNGRKDRMEQDRKEDFVWAEINYRKGVIEIGSRVMQ